MADSQNVLSRVFDLSHMTFDDRKGLLDPENLCLDTSLTTLGVEIEILYIIIIFYLFLTKITKMVVKNHQNQKLMPEMESAPQI